MAWLRSAGQNYFAFTKAASRKQHDKELVQSLINGSLQVPLSAATEREWQKAFWAMELMLYKTGATREKLRQGWQQAPRLSEGFQKALLEVSFTLYPQAFVKPIRGLLQQTASAAVFVRCAEYLLRAADTREIKVTIETLLQTKWKEKKFVGLTILQKRLKEKTAGNLPPLSDVFSKYFLPGKTVVFSLHRKNRNYSGLVLIRTSDGNFVKTGSGQVFHTTQLARAITGYPWYITNGNTPQGIFRWTGFDTSSNNYIGPTTNLQMVMPYEAPPEVFFADSSLAGAAWKPEMYTALLPSSWKAYEPMQQSFWAGAIGRSEIIMHGTTINPGYYKAASFFPQTPSLGCLCSYEEWDATGKRIISHQQQIVEALLRNGSRKGYVVVIDLDDKKAPVTLTEVAALLK